MLAKHDSGLSVLCAPDGIANVSPSSAAIDKLLRTAREDFDYVVVDAGALPPDVTDGLFESATAVYLVTQVSVAELRNANRILKRYFTGAAAGKVEVVLNRFLPRATEIDEAAITKALTRPAKWKVPDDYQIVRRAQNTAVPIVMEDSALALSIRNMARTAAGMGPADQKKKRFGLFS
jgi:pilus assembly protein CpaE